MNRRTSPFTRSCRLVLVFFSFANYINALKSEECNYVQITDGNQFLYMPDVCMGSKRGSNGTDIGSHMYSCTDNGKSVSYYVWSDNSECDKSSDYQVSLIYGTDNSDGTTFKCDGVSDSSCYTLWTIYDTNGKCDTNELNSYNYQEIAVTLNACLKYDPNDVTQATKQLFNNNNNDNNNNKNGKTENESFPNDDSIAQYQLNRHKGKYYHESVSTNDTAGNSFDNLQDSDRSAMWICDSGTLTQEIFTGTSCSGVSLKTTLVGCTTDGYKYYPTC